MSIKKEIEDWSKEFNKIFEKEIHKTLKRQVDLSKIENIIDLKLEDVILSYTSGGKRIRPFIVSFISQKYFDNEDILNTCLALELFHLAALIHDDIIDNADLRRGEKTIHYFVSNYVKNKKTMGQDIALLMGDVFLTRAFYYATKLPDFVQDIFFTMVERTIRGQYIDVLGANEDYGFVDKDLVKARHKLKTAWYTFGTPIDIALRLGDFKYSDNRINELIQMAIEIGFLYQIRDDIKDTIDTKSGKILFGDIFEGHTTWVTLFLKENYKKEFEATKEFVNKEKSTQNIQKLKEIFNNVDFKNAYENEYTERLSMLDRLPDDLGLTKSRMLELLNLLAL